VSLLDKLTNLKSLDSEYNHSVEHQRELDI